MKIIKIKNCEECPYFLGYYLYNQQENKGACKIKLKYYIKEKEIIPTWCPLDNFEFEPAYLKK